MSPKSTANAAADASLLQAREALREGRLREAQALCLTALEQDPQHAQAHYLAAMLAFRRGQAAQAVAGLRHALALQEDLPDAWFNLGTMLHGMGRSEEAEAAYGRDVALHPQSGRSYNNLAALQMAAGRTGQAEASYRQALAVSPDFIEAQQNLAMLLEGCGQLAEAEALLRRSLALQPHASEACNRLGNVLRAAGRQDEAETFYRRAVQDDASNASAHNNLGVLLKDAGRWDEAEQAWRQALAASAECAEAWQNLGLLLQDTGRYAEAETCCRRAMIERPQWAEARYQFACLLLQQGKFSQGWREFESRLRIPGNAAGWRLDAPRWDGVAGLSGKAIMLTAEQGLGDTLQFLRFVPEVAARGATVILAVQPALKSLASHVAGVARVFAFGEAPPPADWQCPLMSLPLALAIGMETIPAQPYLHADPALQRQWQARLGAEGLRVGVVWAGNPRKDSANGKGRSALDRRRSLPFEALHPLLRLDGVQYVSLQVGEEARSQLQGESGVADWGAQLHSFADTAALLAELDLVISVDTAVAHLAGAMGKPVWLLNRYDTCWRWMRERDDSPWYPSMRIFRQESPGDWPGVVARAAAALQQLTSA